jgi:perosamine synthetase
VRHVVHLTRPAVGDSELEAVKRVLDSGILTEGEACATLEREFARYVRSKHAVATSSCTSALHLTLIAAGIGPEDEVVVPDFTFPATANVVRLVGATPVLVDIEPHSYNIDPKMVRQAITPKTRAIIVVHLFGLSADIDPILELARERSITVIEDAACAIGTTYKGTRVGTLGKATCFSFHPRKIVTTGEGGIVTTDSQEIADRVSRLKNHGELKADGHTRFVVPGYNCRLSDLLAAIGVVQLKRIAYLIKSRVRISTIYNELLSDIDGITCPWSRENDVHTYQSYVVKIEDTFGISRDETMSRLRRLGIETQIGTYALHLEPSFCDYYEPNSCPCSEDAAVRTLSLPISSIMTPAQAEYVANSLRKVRRN